MILHRWLDSNRQCLRAQSHFSTDVVETALQVLGVHVSVISPTQANFFV